MTKKMLIDAAHPEEVRVAVLDNGKVEDFDFESAARKPLRGNIYLARVTRVEPSLQAAFVEYGGNRHGFLAFSEIHPDYYQIPVSDRQALQRAEAEVAELAAELELAQRGDEDEFDHDDHGDHDHGYEDQSSDHSSPEEAAPEGEDGGEDADDSSSKTRVRKAAQDYSETADDDPVDEIEDLSSEEEEEEEESGDEAKPPRRRRRTKKKAAAEEKQEPEKDETGDGQPVLAAEDQAGPEPSDPDDAFAEDIAEDPDDPAPAALSDDEGIDVADVESGNGDATPEDTQPEDTQPADGDAAGEEDKPKAKKREKSAAAKRQELFERYKDAKRKRSQLLRNYKIQEVIKRRQILLIQVVKEERGNKGAALTTYMSLAGRYCVLMPNTARGGGISRKIAHSTDRRRLRRVVDSLDVPQGMGLIIRTAGAKRTKTEIKRDYDYLLRLWENIRTLTLKSIAPCLIYEEASLIKRAIRDLYDKDISEVQVEGEAGYREAKDFMKMLMPSHAKHVQPYKEQAPIFLKHGVEAQLDGMYQPSVRLKSGGYIVIHQTEALVAIDVNSGRATRERNIEQTALKTNIEAAYEAARQFRLRDLAGLVVLDFIDMEEQKNNRKVEKALKDAIKHDRARIQLGRISNFGLLEMSRQRRRSGIVDGTTQSCPTCAGAGVIRSAEMAALRILRAIEGEAVSGKAGVLSVNASLDVTVYVLNHHRDWVKRIEDEQGVTIQIIPDPDKAGDDFTLEKSGVPRERTGGAPVIQADQMDMIEPDRDEAAAEADADSAEEGGEQKKRRRRRRRKDGPREAQTASGDDGGEESDEGRQEKTEKQARDGDDDQPRKRRRRGRRGGRRNRRTREDGGKDQGDAAEQAGDKVSADSESGGPQAGIAKTEEGVDTPAPKAEAEVETPETGKDDNFVSQSREPSPAAEKPEKSNGASADENEKAPEDSQVDLADAPQPSPPKRKRRGWWSRAGDA